jgi:hypothetical protein
MPSGSFSIPLVGAEDPDQLVELVVVGLDVVVADRPVVAEAVAAPGLEIPGPKRSEMRPQWLVRPPSMRPRNHMNWLPRAIV